MHFSLLKHIITAVTVNYCLHIDKCCQPAQLAQLVSNWAVHASQAGPAGHQNWSSQVACSLGL